MEPFDKITFFDTRSFMVKITHKAIITNKKGLIKPAQKFASDATSKPTKHKPTRDDVKNGFTPKRLPNEEKVATEKKTKRYSTILN